MPSHFQVDRRPIAGFCQRRGIRKLALFGAVLRDDCAPTGGVDVLVEFESDAHAGFMDMAEMEVELAEILGRRPDLCTVADLSRDFRRHVTDAAEMLYGLA